MGHLSNDQQKTLCTLVLAPQTLCCPHSSKAYSLGASQSRLLRAAILRSKSPFSWRTHVVPTCLSSSPVRCPALLLERGAPGFDPTV